MMRMNRQVKARHNRRDGKGAVTGVRSPGVLPHGRGSVVVAIAAVCIALMSAPALAEPLRSAPPSLDELLGLPETDRDARGEEAAAREAEEALRRRLEEGRQARSAFAEAIEQMVVSADLLDTRFDAGIGTQRIQEDIIAKLTHMIDQACQQCAQSGQRSQSQSPNQEPQRDPGPREQSEQQIDSDSQQDQGEPGEGMPPPLQHGDVHTAIQETRAEWGALPERIREMLLQGMDEKFSSLYEQLTREYYRSLASD